MRKTIDKMIVALLVVVMVFNFTYSNFVPVHADSDQVVTTLVNLLGGVVGIFTWIPRLIAMGIGLAANVLTAQVAYMDGATATNNVRATITPFDIFFNKIQILDVNFLDTEATGAVGRGQGASTKDIRSAVAKWYYVVRLIAISILLLVLLYVGIRMAISSVASEKAAYKRSLVDWIVSLALVFLLQYIIMFTVNANEAIVKSLEAAVTTEATTPSGTKQISDAMSETISELGLRSLGASWEAIAATIVYCMIVFQTFVFLVKYLKRMLTIGFLILISPLISITYSIDKMGDGKAQALNSWLKEFIYNILIQPFHCIMYMAFVDTAFQLLTKSTSWEALDEGNGIANAILAILCIKFIDDGEKIIRKIFGFDQASSLSPLETAAMATAVTQGGKAAVGAAQTARKGINFAKEKGMFSALRKDVNALKDKKQISTKTKALMSQNPGMSKETAKAQATKEVNAIRQNKNKVRDIKSKNNAIRNRKVESKMKESMGEDKFNQLKQQLASGNTAAIAEYKKAYQKADREVPHSAVTRGYKKISGAVGKVANSNVGKYVRHTLAPAGIGLALGSMAYGAGNVGVFTAYGAGNAMYKGGREYFQSSTNTMATEASKYLQDKTTDTSQTRDYINRVKNKGDNGSYEKGSDDTKELQRELLNILNRLGEADGKSNQEMKGIRDDIMADITKTLAKDPASLDIDSILKEHAGEKYAQSETLQNAAQDFADHKSDGFLYDQIKNADDLGVSTDTFVSKVDKQLDYTSTNNKRMDNVVTQIQKNENTEEIINKIDSTDFDQVLKQIESKITELQNIDLTDKLPEVKTQIDSEITRLQTAGDAIRDKISSEEGA